MRLAGLQFDKIPPLNVPFRFYLTASVFGMLAGLLIMLFGEQLWLSRWMPVSLALTHIIALGVMATIMFGSLFQLLPVLCGTPIRLNSKVISSFLISFSLGVLALAAGFMQWLSFLPALVLLALSLSLFIGILLYTLWWQAQGKFTRLPILLAVLCLGLTLVLGLSFLVNLQWGILGALTKSWTNIHAAFGVFGWVLLLIITVSFQVIPMFHVTPEFPEKMRRFFPYVFFIVLVGLAIENYVNNSLTSSLLLYGLIAVYVVIALKKLSQRKRKLPDTTIWFWQLALTSLLVSLVLLAMLQTNLLATEIATKLEIVIGLIIGFAVVLSVIQGMLLKIVPFLITLHLQTHAMNHPMGMGLMPDHYQLISRKHGKYLFYGHLLLISSIILSVLYTPFTFLIGIILTFSMVFLWYLILNAAKAYKKIHIAISQT